MKYSIWIFRHYKTAGMRFVCVEDASFNTWALSPEPDGCYPLLRFRQARQGLSTAFMRASLKSVGADIGRMAPQQ